MIYLFRYVETRVSVYLAEMNQLIKEKLKTLEEGNEFRALYACELGSRA